MCGRFVTVSSPAILVERFDIDDVQVEPAEPNYNVTPRAEIAIVRERNDRRVLSAVRWGLVPSWAKDPSVGDRMINARAESLLDKSAFRNAFEKRRCLVPADGFYEWQRLPAPAGTKKPRKQPMFIRRRDGEPMAFAGLWEVWKPRDNPEAEWMRSATIITTDANALLMPVHDRMPAMLAESEWEHWLNPENHDVEALHALLAPAPDDELEMWPVADLVSSPDNNGPALVERVERAQLFDAD